MTKDELGRALMQRCHISGNFRLSSGPTATKYFDKYLFEADPVLLRETALLLGEFVPPSTEAIAGLELGGIPIATAVSQVTHLPTLFVRKVAKDYGTCQLVEGGDVRGRTIVVIEDVVTSGGQLLKSSMQLRELGADVLRVIAVIDREQGGNEALAAAGFAFASFFNSINFDEDRPAAVTQSIACVDDCILSFGCIPSILKP
jgi:orotate phosphoribosyltransferase